MSTAAPFLTKEDVAELREYVIAKGGQVRRQCRRKFNCWARDRAGANVVPRPLGSAEPRRVYGPPACLSLQPEG